MFSVFRRNKRSTTDSKNKGGVPGPYSNKPLPPPPHLGAPPPNGYVYNQNNGFNPVMYVTAPETEQHQRNQNSHHQYQYQQQQQYQYQQQQYQQCQQQQQIQYQQQHNEYLQHQERHHQHHQQNGYQHHEPQQKGYPPALQNGYPLTPQNGYKPRPRYNEINIGPPPVQSKWVNLDDPQQTVRKARSRSQQPNVVRSNSAGSVKSKCSSVNSSYSCKSEQYKNSVRIPDTKFSGTWASNESFSSRQSSQSRVSKRYKEWEIGVKHHPEHPVIPGVKHDPVIIAPQHYHPLKPPASVKSSCGNVSSDSSRHPPFLGGGCLSSGHGTPPPAYQGDPLSGSNGYINKRTTAQHPGTTNNNNNTLQQHQINDTMLSGFGSPIQLPGRIVAATLYKTTKGFGFTLSGGDKAGQAVLIKSVKQGSPADTQGGLKAGDILVKVNAQVVSHLSHSGVVQLFKEIPNGSEARLELRRNDPMSPQQQHQQQHHQHQHHQQQPYSNGRNHGGYQDQGAESSSSRSTGSVNNVVELIPIYIDKGEAGFGFTIHQSSAGQRVKTIMDRSRCAYLLEGDLIIQINQEPLMDRSHAETVQILKRVPPFTRTLLLINRSEVDTKRKDKKNRSFRSKQHPPITPHHVPPPHMPPHAMTSSRGIKNNPLTQPRTPLTVPAVDSNRLSDHGGSQLSGSDRHPLWEHAPPPQWADNHVTTHAAPETMDYGDLQVNLQKDNNGFGFKVIGGEEQGIPVAIGHVTPHGPAEGKLQIYDEIRTVNGQSVMGAYHTGVLSLISQAAAMQGKISLVIRRHKNPELLFNMAGLPLPELSMDLSRYRLINIRNVTVTKQPGENFGFVIHSSLRAEDTFKIGQIVPESPAGRCGDLLEGDSVITVDGTPITGLQHRTVVELIKKCGTTVVLGVGTPQLIEQDEEEEDWRNQTEEIPITLVRDERGFGFSIRGGKAFQREDTLFVLRIGEGGAADKDGRLRRGDEIIEINGQSMIEVPHQEAVDKIKSGGGALNITVRRRKLEMPPIIQLGLEDKPQTLQYPERTDITSERPKKDGELSEKTASTSSREDLEGVSRDQTMTSLSRDQTMTSSIRHEYDKYEPPEEPPTEPPED